MGMRSEQSPIYTNLMPEVNSENVAFHIDSAVKLVKEKRGPDATIGVLFFILPGKDAYTWCKY